MIYNDKHSSFHELLKRDGSVSIHKRNLRSHAIEMFEIMKGTALPLVSEMFSLKGRNEKKWKIALTLESKPLTLFFAN